MPFSLRPHDYTKIPGTDLTRITSTNDYIRIVSHGKTFFIQTGAVWTEDSVEHKDPPKWFWEEAGKCSAEALFKAGCDRKFLERAGVTVPAADTPPQWLVDAMKEHNITTPGAQEVAVTPRPADDITAPDAKPSKPVRDRVGETADDADTGEVVESAATPQARPATAKVVRKVKRKREAKKHGDDTGHRRVDQAGRTQDNLG